MRHNILFSGSSSLDGLDIRLLEMFLFLLSFNRHGSNIATQPHCYLHSLSLSRSTWNLRSVDKYRTTTRASYQCLQDILEPDCLLGFDGPPSRTDSPWLSIMLDCAARITFVSFRPRPYVVRIQLELIMYELDVKPQPQFQKWFLLSKLCCQIPYFPWHLGINYLEYQCSRTFFESRLTLSAVFRHEGAGILKCIDG